MKYVFLINSFSLKKRTDEVKNKIIQVANNLNLDYIIEVNSSTYSTEDILKKYKDTKNVIICLGGDGTINRVLNSVVGTKNILGYIPFGTGNDFYRTNKELLKSGINKIDLIKINNRYFINVACFGIDADIANSDNIVHSKLIPKTLRYKVSILKHFISYKPRLMKVILNKEKYKDYYTTVAVCNAKYYGGGFNINPKANLNDGLFEVYLVESLSKVKMANLILSMKKAKHINSKYIKILSTNNINIKFPNSVKANIDGDIIESKNFNIKLIKNGISIYYDQELIDKVLK